MHIDEGISRPSIDKFLFAADDSLHRDPQLDNTQKARNYGISSKLLFIICKLEGISVLLNITLQNQCSKSS